MTLPAPSIGSYRSKWSKRSARHSGRTIFRLSDDRLRPGGTVVLQAITIDEPPLRVLPSIPRLHPLDVFPGGMLPTRSALLREAEKVGLSLLVFRAVRRELRANARRNGAGVSWLPGSRLKPWAFLKNFAECGTITSAIPRAASEGVRSTSDFTGSSAAPGNKGSRRSVASNLGVSAEETGATTWTPVSF